ncbi:Unknown protein sequence [Pseudomonas coronafaciens pv. oryzae]|nr:Unknown protein sequence [Pseudomonas coronafaciens pv. oryzae]
MWGLGHGASSIKDGAIVDSRRNMRQTHFFRVDHKYFSWSREGA